LLEDELQLTLRRHTQHDQVARLLRPFEASSCLQAGMTNLNDLLRK
jgi:hypothetical protein